MAVYTTGYIVRADCSILITNRKSHTDFRLIPTMTLNGVMAFILGYFTELCSVSSRYVKPSEPHTIFCKNVSQRIYFGTISPPILNPVTTILICSVHFFMVM